MLVGARWCSLVLVGARRALCSRMVILSVSDCGPLWRSLALVGARWCSLALVGARWRLRRSFALVGARWRLFALVCARWRLRRSFALVGAHWRSLALAGTRLPIRAEFVPVVWLHENSGRVTTGFAGQGKIMVILTLAYFGLRIAYLPRVAVLFGALSGAS